MPLSLKQVQYFHVSENQYLKLVTTSYNFHPLHSEYVKISY